ncbi:hypothetical protein [Ferruginibacter sp. HRS2-29]|uniref:hypothetical protein n=1 Tax=Ferruginibacter sp. HRS2-29 TaxID=2487334 RepID=UPI0020CFA555|nr:hypothetical protein [Ferruginibacter sp. HRS2-29]MCP9749819.1 hypothetical protein [Ferruginibacter sp. HRS2-29]
MAKYIVNIEVENAAEADYITLEDAMSKMYFKTENHTSAVVPYYGGSRRFSRFADIGLQEVSGLVKKAAVLLGKKYSFFIIRQRSLR